MRMQKMSRKALSKKKSRSICERWVANDRIRISPVEDSLADAPLERPAKIKAVTRIEAMADILAVPKHVAPTGDSILEHALFALKHESLQLAVLPTSDASTDPVHPG